VTQRLHTLSDGPALLPDWRTLQKTPVSVASVETNQAFASARRVALLQAMLKLVLCPCRHLRSQRILLSAGHPGRQPQNLEKKRNRSGCAGLVGYVALQHRAFSIVRICE
jgi:hypothetical protein